jgi:hypothetical protein
MPRSPTSSRIIAAARHAESVVEIAGAKAALDGFRRPSSISSPEDPRAHAQSSASYRCRQAPRPSAQSSLGALGRSIQQETHTSGEITTGRVYSSGDVKYAAIHEFGGTDAAARHRSDEGRSARVHDGRPADLRQDRPSSWLAHSGAELFMRSGLFDMSDEIVAGIREAALWAPRRRCHEPQ